jgi:hypothetical protein
LTNYRSSGREAKTVNEPPQHQDSLQDPAELDPEPPPAADEVELAPRATRLRVVLLLSLACWSLVILAIWAALRLL